MPRLAGSAHARTPHAVWRAQSVWLFGAGWGFRKLLNWVANRYGAHVGDGLPIYCTEAGWSVAAKNSLEGKYDPGRLMYYHSYLQEAHKAMEMDKVGMLAAASGIAVSVTLSRAVRSAGRSAWLHGMVAYGQLRVGERVFRAVRHDVQRVQLRHRPERAHS